LGFDADPTPPSKRKIAHGRTVKGPLERYWENDLLPLLVKDGALQSVTLRRTFKARIRWRSPTIVFGAPWSGGCGSGGR